MHRPRLATQQCLNAQEYETSSTGSRSSSKPRVLQCQAHAWVEGGREMKGGAQVDKLVADARGRVEKVRIREFGERDRTSGRWKCGGWMDGWGCWRKGKVEDCWLALGCQRMRKAGPAGPEIAAQKRAAT
ncbi:hypothetical protein GLAREA_11877 [Glarea lozoyensis ATCC 20868]|uniref:Uncharacterized protein n=1 Tax=Glarea lozoyensis (strain ATCC 20868 / MF5171) TaxID=1116229 RepID=S3D1Y3_GLAL2|nr:uncharacterized protein GLAREA_11877 [Glarea lozoyensis ATCC 20868]EPE31795.1 hypothetical protein GLAREA_11877 [Glarea lozoyensis ATCC 20868]